MPALSWWPMNWARLTNIPNEVLLVESKSTKRCEQTTASTTLARTTSSTDFSQRVGRQSMNQRFDRVAINSPAGSCTFLKRLPKRLVRYDPNDVLRVPKHYENDFLAQDEERVIISRQILREAAFMAADDEPSDPSESLEDVHAFVPFHTTPSVRDQKSPEGLTVTLVKDESLKWQNHILEGIASVFNGIHSEHNSCQNCATLERKLNELSCDIEFLRGLDKKDSGNPAENDIKTCKQCVHMAKNAFSEKEELISLHKQQMKSIMRERAEYQQTMESELGQFTNRCRVLSREVALQEREKVALQHETEDLKAELDRLFKENLLLKSQLSNNFLHKHCHVNGSEVTGPKRGKLEGKESNRESNDRLIGELRAKLEKATRDLETERTQRSLLSRILASSQAP